MKRTVWMMAAVGIVLLGFAACGSAAPESPDENTLFAANGPALTVVEKQPDQYTTDPDLYPYAYGSFRNRGEVSLRDAGCLE